MFPNCGNFRATLANVAKEATMSDIIKILLFNYFFEKYIYLII